jgi:hypothetical protein
LTLSPLDVFENNFGFVNAPFAALTVLPPFDVLYRLVWRPVRAAIPPGLPPVYVPPAPTQTHVMGVVVGAFANDLPSAFGAIFANPRQLPQINERLTAAGFGSAVVTKVANDTRIYPSFQIQVYHTPRLVSQNTFRYSRSGLSLELQNPGGGGSVIVQGNLHMYEWAGSLRFNLLTGRIQPFVKAGFGYSWYRVQDVTVAGERLATPTSPFLHVPSVHPWTRILPNTLHYGAGIEATLTQPKAPLTGVGFALKFETNFFAHSLGLDIQDDSQLGLSIDAPVFRPSLDLAMVVMF